MDDTNAIHTGAAGGAMRVRTPGTWTLPATLLLLVATGLVACGTTAPTGAASGDRDATPQRPDTQSGGALLWEQNCNRCHNYRPPRERSDREWAIIVHHMRVRANLTADEHEGILRFMQAAN